jgi:hypothetical protein
LTYIKAALPRAAQRLGMTDALSPSSRSSGAPTLRFAAASAATLLFLLTAITLLSGVSQQHFEWVHAPNRYAADLLRDEAVLRVLVALDDLFVASYVAVGLLLATSVSRGSTDASVRVVSLVAAGLALVGGVLDLAENHHLLAMVRLAHAEVPIPVTEILARSEQSQLKWMLGHLAFALLGVVLPTRDGWTRAFRVSLVGWQLPIGAITWALPEGPWLEPFVWLRYAAFLSGFAFIAWRASAVGAGERGARA